MLKTVYATAEEIPEGYADLYTEKNGQWELTGVIGVKTQADIDRINAALVKERKDHKAAKEDLKRFEGVDLDQIEANASALEEAKAQLEAINKDGRVDETKLEPIIAARLKQAVAPLERDKVNLERKLEALNKTVADKDGENNNLRMTITTGNVERAIRDAAAEAKILTTAIFDAVRYGKDVFEVTEDNRVITKDVAGVVPGLTPKEWFKDMLEKSPHWWPTSVGGGANGGRGPTGRASNPWSKEGWNITKQGAYVTEHGIDKAKTAAESVGSKIGATKPPA